MISNKYYYIIAEKGKNFEDSDVPRFIKYVNKTEANHGLKCRGKDKEKYCVYEVEIAYKIREVQQNE